MPMALRNCYAHFRRNPFCGALTGELKVERPYRNFLTTVQFMEWKVSIAPLLSTQPSACNLWHSNFRLALCWRRTLCSIEGARYWPWEPCTIPAKALGFGAAGVARAVQAHRVPLRLSHCAARCILCLPLGGCGGEPAFFVAARLQLLPDVLPC
jgi:hypothetical protein